MKEKTYAAIDIGSNAARLLIKRTENDSHDGSSGNDVCPKLRKLLLLRVPLRLGFDVFTRGEVSDKKADNLLRLMKAYRQLLKIYDVDRMRACATSAMRDAANGPELIKLIRKETGIEIEIIPGQEEATIVYNNHIERSGTSAGNFLYVDVGGGSTELNFISDGQLVSSRSFNIGTVRILTDKVKPGEWDAMNDYLSQIASEYKDIAIIGSGGNINKIYKMARVKDAAEQSMPVDELAIIYHALEPLSVEQRMERYNLRADRADVIIPAARIFLNIAALTGATRIIVPTIGVADGIIDGLLLKDCAD